MSATRRIRRNSTEDPTFDSRLQLAYENALEFWVWSGLYGEKSHLEYWAEGVEAWFYDIGPGRMFETKGRLFETIARCFRVFESDRNKNEVREGDSSFNAYD